MAIKDLETSENIDRSGTVPEGENKKPITGDGQAGNVKETGNSTVKNAHAAGSGAIGRNESGLPEDDGIGNRKEEPGY